MKTGIVFIRTSENVRNFGRLIWQETILEMLWRNQRNRGRVWPISIELNLEILVSNIFFVACILTRNLYHWFIHRPPTTGPSDNTQPFISAVRWGWPDRNLWGHWGQTARDLCVLVLPAPSPRQPQWRHRVGFCQQQFTDEVDGWRWQHSVFLYSSVESDVILHSEWLRQDYCLQWVDRLFQ